VLFCFQAIYKQKLSGGTKSETSHHSTPQLSTRHKLNIRCFFFVYLLFAYFGPSTLIQLCLHLLSQRLLSSKKNLVKYFGDFPSLYTIVLYQERTISVPIDHKSRRDLAYRQPSLNNCTPFCFSQS
jgi:hypothetical protein